MNAQPIVGAASPYDVASVRRDFPILATTVRGKRLAFLDTAASSQRPLSVIEAVNHYERTSHANVHRGVYQLSQRATDAFEGARERVRRFLNAASIKEVVFTRGTTESINLVAQSWGRRLQPGDEILVTWMTGSHNGCSLQFGPDGMLYFSAGDSGENFPPDGYNTGQRIDDLLASILRIDVDHPETTSSEPGKPPKLYSIPADNPFVDVPGARGEV